MREKWLLLREELFIVSGMKADEKEGRKKTQTKYVNSKGFRLALIDVRSFTFSTEQDLY